MKLVKPSYEILSKIDSKSIQQNLEIAGRTCYKSEDRITDDSADKFVSMIIKRGHESVLEHEKITVKFICDRGVSHEIVRHRICSFSQESTRYVNYNNKGMEFIIPCWLPEIPNNKSFPEKGEEVRQFLKGFNPFNYEGYQGIAIWLYSMEAAEDEYNRLIESGWKPEQARSILPNSLKTEIVVTANIRQWREIFRQRTAKAAHPQMRELMIPLLEELKLKLPVLFIDIKY